MIIKILQEPNIPGTISAVFGFAIGLVCGTYGNGWYLRHAQNVFSEVGPEVLEPATRVRVISEKYVGAGLYR